MKLTIREGDAKYRLQVATHQEYQGMEEEHHYAIDVDMAYKINRETGISCHLQFSLPVFNDEEEYNKEQWLYTKIFSINQQLVLQLNQAGKFISVINSDEIVKNWREIKNELVEGIYSESNEVAAIVHYMDHNLRHNLNNIYIKDSLLQWLCNDLYHNYKIVGNPIITHKKLLGHFGVSDLVIQEEKSIEKFDENTFELNLEGNLLPEEMDLPAINNYLADFVAVAGEKDYEFSYNGHYTFHQHKQGIKEGCLLMTGRIPGFYSKTTQYKLNQL